MKNPLYSLLLLPVVLIGGCSYWVFLHDRFSELTDEISTRKDAAGKVLDEFIEIRHDRQRGILPGPHGFVPAQHEVWFTFHLREPGKPMRELAFLRDERSAWFYCRPVPDSRLWAVFCETPTSPCTYQLLVFDDTHIVRRRDFAGVGDESEIEARCLFEDGNRKFVYVSPKGIEAYDILTETVKPWTGSFSTRQKINGLWTDVVLRPPFKTK